MIEHPFANPMIQFEAKGTHATEGDWMGVARGQRSRWNNYAHKYFNYHLN